MMLPSLPAMPTALVRKGVVPAALIAALSSPLAYHELERLEGNIHKVYADHLAGGLPTYCAGRTDPKAVVGTRLTSDQCREVNKVTLIEYGYAVLSCTNWDHLTERRLIGLTLFAINVGKARACGSESVRQINAGNISLGCRLLSTRPDGTPNWSYVGATYIQGLQNRRQAERALCASGESWNG